MPNKTESVLCSLSDHMQKTILTFTLKLQYGDSSSYLTDLWKSNKISTISRYCCQNFFIGPLLLRKYWSYSHIRLINPLWPSKTFTIFSLFYSLTRSLTSFDLAKSQKIWYFPFMVSQFSNVLIFRQYKLS